MVTSITHLGVLFQGKVFALVLSSLSLTLSSTVASTLSEKVSLQVLYQEKFSLFLSSKTFYMNESQICVESENSLWTFL